NDYNGSYHISLNVLSSERVFLAGASQPLLSPSYNYTQFEPYALLGSVYYSENLDFNNDSCIDVVRVNVPVNIYSAGSYYVEARLYHEFAGIIAVRSSGPMQVNSTGSIYIPLDFSADVLRPHGQGNCSPVDVRLYNNANALLDTNADPGLPITNISWADLEPAPGVMNDYYEVPSDSDGDGYYNILVIYFNVTVGHSGRYYLYGRLSPLSVSESKTIWLEAGKRQVNFTFSGYALYHSSVSPEWTLTDVMLYDLEQYYYVGYGADYGLIYDDYTAYDRGSTIVSVEEAPVDIDGDLKYDFLVINLYINSELEGNYHVAGALFAPGDFQIEYKSQNIFMSEGQHIISLVFDGTLIFDRGLNGPYYLSEVYLIFNDYPPYLFEEVHLPSVLYTTSSYSWTDFDGYGAEFTGTFSYEAQDDEPDGYYNWLFASAYVDVNTAGNYAVFAYLMTATNQLLLSETWAGYLGVGSHEISVRFNGTALFQFMYNGMYKIGFQLYDIRLERKIDEAPEAITTSSYSYTEFQPPVPPESWNAYIIADSGLNTGGDSKYEFLNITLVIEAPRSGTFLIKYRLFESDSLPECRLLVNLTAGTNYIYLHYPGWYIRHHGAEGSIRFYTVEFLQIKDAADNQEFWSGYYFYNTASSYNNLDFMELAYFAGTFSYTLLDPDSDGRIDYILFNATVFVNMSGNYMFRASIYNSSTYMDQRYGIYYLEPGLNNVSILFNGLYLSGFRQSGSYEIADIMLVALSDIYPGEAIVDTFDPYFLPYLEYTAFEGVIPVGWDWYLLDENSDGFYDYVCINITIEKSISSPLLVMGDFVMVWPYIAQVGGDSNVIYNTMQFVNITFRLEAFLLSQIQTDSIVALYRFTVIELENSWSLYYTDNLTASPLLNWLQMSVPPGVARFISDTPVDYDGNGLYDVINYTYLVSVQTAGLYTIAGTLYDHFGVSRVYFSQRYWLTPGLNSINVSAYGPLIYYYQLSGYLRLGYVVLYNQNMNSVGTPWY
ncbi:MAG: hypothetical protein QW728_06335, partial [Thermoplasmata archaeon]